MMGLCTSSLRPDKTQVGLGERAEHLPFLGDMSRISSVEGFDYVIM